MSTLPDGVLRAVQQAGEMFYMRDHPAGERAEVLEYVANVHNCIGNEELIGEIADWYGARLRKRHAVAGNVDRILSGLASLAALPSLPEDARREIRKMIE